MMNNGRPLSRKQTARMMVAMTILAWATQTLLRQWGYGAELPASAPTEPAEVQAEPAERFMPGTSRFGSGATLEVRAEATVVGSEVTLKQICRWSDSDKTIFDPVGDLVLVRLAPKAPFKAIAVDEIRGLMRDAGVNLAAINFAGATSCTIARSDVEYDEKTALQQWIDAKQGPESAKIALSPTNPPASAPASAPSVAAVEESPIKTLRKLLVADLAGRLNLPVEALQVSFRDQDDKVLSASEPLFKFQIDPVRAKGLGTVMWNVSVTADAGSKKVSIMADAKAWQDQVVVSKPLAFKQLIREDDVIERRALVDQITGETLLKRDQIVGQQASRDLKPGTVFTGRLIDPVELVKTGQFVTVTLEQGNVKVKTVGRAMEAGCYGQTIRVKNEATKEILQVVVTGPQTATMNLAAPLASVGAGN